MEGRDAEITLRREKNRWRRGLERVIVRKNPEEKRSRRRVGSGLADGQNDEQDPGERCLLKCTLLSVPALPVGAFSDSQEAGKLVGKGC